jgi:hypothetical protein
MHVGNLQKKPGYVKAKQLIGHAARDQDDCVQEDENGAKRSSNPVRQTLSDHPLYTMRLTKHRPDVIPGLLISRTETLLQLKQGVTKDALGRRFSHEQTGSK